MSDSFLDERYENFNTQLLQNWNFSQEVREAVLEAARMSHEQDAFNQGWAEISHSRVNDEICETLSQMASQAYGLPVKVSMAYMNMPFPDGSYTNIPSLIFTWL